jgi:fumarate reductase flavoprotein subunit
MNSTDREKAISRRTFLGIGGVAAASVAAASLAACGSTSGTPGGGEASTGTGSGAGGGAPAEDLGGSIAVMRPIAESEIAETADFDIVVIGGGIAGAVAAATAAEEGKKVAVLQKAEVAISNGAGAAAWNSKMVREGGTEFDPWVAVTDWTRQGENRADLDLLKTWIYNSGPTMDWLIPLTNDVEGVGPVMGGGSADFGDEDLWTRDYPTVHMWIGQMQALAQWLLDYAEQNGATIYYSTPAVQIVRDNKKVGKVSGVIAKKEDDSYLKLNAASAVILAAGDYGNNPVLRAQYLPHAEGLPCAYMRPDINKGDGQYMGMYVGGKMQLAPHCSNIHYDPPVAVPDVPGSGIPWLFVNKNGKRFCNEDMQYGQLYAQDMNQPDYMHYQIFDENFRTDYLDMGEGMMRGAFFGIELGDAVDAAVAEGKVYKASTIEELAAQIKIPANALKATVDRYNVLCDAGYDDDYGKQAARLKPVKQGPFYAVARQPGILCTLNGIITDGNCQALDESRQVIEGLYVVGNCQGNFFGGLEHQMIIPGMSLGRAITTGRVAGLLASGKEIAGGKY